jgi:hypothetical protein
LAKIAGIDVLILPRIGISKERNRNSIEVLAYQMMGKEVNGNTVLFLIPIQTSNPHMVGTHVKYIKTDHLHVKPIL